MTTAHVYLVPRFFGFTSISSLSSFNGMSSTLGRCLRLRGIKCRIVECKTQPTGSIRNRVDRLLSSMIENGGLEADAIHIIGHSTGGLDIRLLVTPGVRPRLRDVEALGRRTRSVITLQPGHLRAALGPGGHRRGLRC